MAKAIITAEEHGSLPDALKAEYAPVTTEGSPHKGRLMLRVTGVDGYELEDVRGLKATVSATRTEREKADARIKELEATADKATKRVVELEAIDPASEADKLAAARVESTTKQMREKHAQDLTAKDAAILKLQGGLQHALIRSESIAAITKQKGSVPLLLNALMAECALKSRELPDGTTEYYAVVLDDAKNPRIADAQGNIMTIEQRVVEMKSNDDFARAFDGTEAKGAGRSTETGRQPAPRPQGTVKTPAQKIADGIAKMRAEAT